VTWLLSAPPAALSAPLPKLNTCAGCSCCAWSSAGLGAAEARRRLRAAWPGARPARCSVRDALDRPPCAISRGPGRRRPSCMLDGRTAQEVCWSPWAQPAGQQARDEGAIMGEIVDKRRHTAATRGRARLDADGMWRPLIGLLGPAEAEGIHAALVRRTRGGDRAARA
jgi:hypothetical protein